MVTGVHGSRGESALHPAGEERGPVSVSVTVHPLATVVGHVQETPPSCLGVTPRPAQVRHFGVCVCVCLCVCVSVSVCLCLCVCIYLYIHTYIYIVYLCSRAQRWKQSQIPSLFVRWASEGTREHHREHQ